MNIFFTSDTHFFHSNIIRYCNRPFLKKGDLDNKGNWISRYISKERTKEMNKLIIKNWNERVSKNDLVFHLGDFCFKYAPSETPNAPKNAYDIIKPQLNGDIILIRGNHDGARNGTKTIIESLVINFGGERLFLTHVPEFCHMNYKLNLVGHVHNNWKFKRFRRGKSFTDCCNVGVDVWDFRPIDINQIMGAYTEWLKDEANILC